MKTQANKLAAILRFGTLSMVSWQQIIKEQKKPGKYLETIEERLREINKRKNNNNQCWEFTPYNEYEGLERTRQYSNSPFTLINHIFEIL